MLKLEELFKIEEPKKKKHSQRAQFISEIYDIYISEQQRNFRKRENWKRYITWLKDNRTPDSKENQAKFKKSKSFIKEHSVKTIVFFVSHIPTADLHYILSLAKDMQFRNQNFSSYLLGSLKVK